jgi:hypothetical protein
MGGREQRTRCDMEGVGEGRRAKGPRRFIGAAACALAVWLIAASSASAIQLKWSGRILLEGNNDGLIGARGVSCAAKNLCAAVDSAGEAFISTNPTAWRTSKWNGKSVDSTRLNGIACRPSLCVAVDGNGNAVTTTNPSSSSPTWSSPFPIDSPNGLMGIACPATNLCVAVDTAGNVVTSTNPTGGSGKWHAALVDSGHIIEAVSCASTTFCVAVDRNGNSVSSTNPTGGPSAWKLHTGVDSTNELAAVSCPTASLCVAVDQTGTGGDILTSTSPATAAAWKPQVVVINYHTPFGVSCASKTLCVAVDDSGRAFASSNPTGGSAAWNAIQADSRWSLLNVSCVAPGVCVAGDQGDNIDVGLLPPNTTIVGKSINQHANSATFRFTATGVVAGYQCALRRGSRKATFSSCASPKTYKHLAAGKYTFLVRAFDAAGPDPSPARKSFQIT